MTSQATSTVEPEVFRDHPLREELIDPDAVKIVRRLKRHGFEAYLVGGCVRDLALGLRPKDFDVATSATPRQIRRLFRNCRIIGRRFRLCHIFFHDKIIEVATFRTEPLARLEEDDPKAARKADRASRREHDGDGDGDGDGDDAATADEDRAESAEDADGAGDASDARDLHAPDDEPVEAAVEGRFGLESDEQDDFLAGLMDPSEAGGPLEDDDDGAGDAEDLASWEVDDESDLREKATIAGRRARARDEAAGGIAEADDEDDEREDTADEEDEGGGRRRRSRGRGGDDDDGDDRSRRRGGRRRRYDEDEEEERYGTADEDARLRDFTINALFYEPDEDAVIDYVGGWEDLEDRLVRVIGDPDARMIEDPVRIVRAVKFTARNELRLELETWKSMVRCAGHLAECSPRRLLEEVFKLLASGASVRCFRLLAELGAVGSLAPQLEQCYPKDLAHPAYRFLEALDQVPAEDMDPALLVATLYYYRIRERWARAGLLRPGEEDAPGARRKGDREGRAETIADEEIGVFAKRGSMSRRARAVALRILMAMRLMRRPHGPRATRILARDWFPLALTLLEVTVKGEGADPAIVDLWVERARAVRDGDLEPDDGYDDDDHAIDRDVDDDAPPRRRRRRRRRD